MKTRLIYAVLVATVTSLGLAGQAMAEFPERPIKLIVPFPAGSSTDTVARIIAPAMSDKLGQPVVVENQPGASGAIGALAVASAHPDGYTIGLGTTTTLATAPALNPNLPYKPAKDFAPIGMITSAPYVLSVSTNLRVDSVAALVKKAKSAPGKVRYASAGPASLARLAGALFAKEAGVKLTHIPYKTSAQSVLDLVAGRVDMQFGTIPPVLPHIQSKKIVALAVTGSKRASVLPNVPTLQEVGYKDYDVSLWQALVAPAATPKGVVAKLNGALAAALADTKVAHTLAAQGQVPAAGSSEALSKRMGTETVQWTKVGQEAGLIAK